MVEDLPIVVDRAAGAPELVTVVSHARLVDGESQERVYWRRDGKGLTPGCYVVSWRPGLPRYTFNEEAEFVGPLRTDQEVEEALQAAAARWAKRHGFAPGGGLVTGTRRARPRLAERR